MHKLMEKAIAARVALTAHADRLTTRARGDESGQGTVEYVGAILLVVAIVGVVIAANNEVGKAIVTQLTNAVNDIGGEGGE
ncbi:hypothetical protein [Myceligenerans pegani]|uniref:Pilus assembly protein Flp/PilA n=1 Tax=Myceligenerans pegani TaxID=2776917 RepID=A0ABR9N4J4_9MICO|nr:hypothetical protein [Myceligenerans sp. TRM 65318]MBE1878579.1 hypothetical protein [Myceligenerans sp. TRM 65318]MBE3020850.1 hypothetical protein [Myceligenerans sp. TRM 65318]